MRMQTCAFPNPHYFLAPCRSPVSLLLVVCSTAPTCDVLSPQPSMRPSSRIPNQSTLKAAAPGKFHIPCRAKAAVGIWRLVLRSLRGRSASGVYYRWPIVARWLGHQNQVLVDPFIASFRSAIRSEYPMSECFEPVTALSSLLPA